MEISKSQESYLQAEPISFDLKLSNQTRQPISWRGSLSGGSSLNFSVTNAAGVEKRFDGNKYATGFVYTLLKVMQPGEQVQASLLLDTVLLEELFSNPGQHNFQVEFVYDRDVPGEPRTKILSNSISIKILEPEGVNRQAYQYIKEKFGFANQQRLDNRAKARLMQEFVDRYRDSVYAKYEIIRLGNLYQAMGEDAKALRELCKVSDENFHYSKQVLKEVLLLDAKLYPVVFTPLPDNAPDPVEIHPCEKIRAK